MQQLAKQEAVPKASEQKVIEEDDEQGHNAIKDQFGNGLRDQLIEAFQIDRHNLPPSWGEGSALSDE